MSAIPQRSCSAAGGARRWPDPSEASAPEAPFDRELLLAGLPPARRALVYAARTLAGVASLGGAWTLVRLVHAAPSWTGFAGAAAVAAAWCGWLEIRPPRH